MLLHFSEWIRRGWRENYFMNGEFHPHITHYHCKTHFLSLWLVTTKYLNLHLKNLWVSPNHFQICCNTCQHHSNGSNLLINWLPAIKSPLDIISLSSRKSMTHHKHFKMKAGPRASQASYRRTLDANTQTVANAKIALWVYSQKPGVRQETGNRPLMGYMLYFSSLLPSKEQMNRLLPASPDTYMIMRPATTKSLYFFSILAQGCSESLFAFALSAADALPWLSG